MIVLDTNVISEPLRPAASPSVLAWLDRQNIETLFLTTISLAELISAADGYIAATAMAAGFAVATRDARPFVAAGVTVIDPWSFG